MPQPRNNGWGTNQNDEAEILSLLLDGSSKVIQTYQQCINEGYSGFLIDNILTELYTRFYMTISVIFCCIPEFRLSGHEIRFWTDKTLRSVFQKP